MTCDSVPYILLLINANCFQNKIALILECIHCAKGMNTWDLCLCGKGKMKIQRFKGSPHSAFYQLSILGKKFMLYILIEN